MQGWRSDFGKQVGHIVYRAVVDTINVPEKDHFQVITTHNADSLVYRLVEVKKENWSSGNGVAQYAA